MSTAYTSTNRRHFLKYTCSACALILTPGFAFANPGNQYLVKDVKGSLQVNQKDAAIGSSIKAGDQVSTAANSTAVLLFGEDSYYLKPSTTFTLPNQTLQDNSASLVSGAILAAFRPGKSKKILVNQKATLVIRGTGVYIGIEPEMTEFCLCYGSADLVSDQSNVSINTESKFHKDLVILNDGEIRPAYWYERRMTHTSRQNIELEKIAGRSSPFDGGYRDFVANFESAEL